MLKQEPVPLSSLERFSGAGVYALYYSGDFPLYLPISEENRNLYCSVPIYVGKAVPDGARKGGIGPKGKSNYVLFKRLVEHLNSIDAATNLKTEDFQCRYLVADDIWIPLAETLLIERFSPLWNKVLDGFGNHTPGVGRFNQQRSHWDTIHPGRSWALRCRVNDTPEQKMRERIISFLGARSQK